MLLLAPYAPAQVQIWSDRNADATNRMRQGTVPVTAAPIGVDYAIDLQERVRHLREVIEEVPNDRDAAVTVLEATVTGQHAIVQIGPVENAVGSDFISFARQMFPESLPLNELDERAYNEIVGQFYQPIDLGDDQ